jgi:hypothetical protein
MQPKLPQAEDYVGPAALTVCKSIGYPVSSPDRRGPAPFIRSSARWNGPLASRTTHSEKAEPFYDIVRAGRIRHTVKRSTSSKRRFPDEMTKSTEASRP